MIWDAETAQDALQLEALLLSRAYLYELFHKLFGGSPDEELLDALLGDIAADAVEEFSGNSVELTAFGSFLAKLKATNREELLDSAKDEYTRVFIGPLALPASPYESPYTGAHDMATFQQNTLVVRELYREQGLQVKRFQAIPDDHVAIMCAFAAEMSERALVALRAGEATELVNVLRSQRAFVSEHLANWLGTFATSVRNSKAGSHAVMYPQLIEALHSLAKADVDFLAESAFWTESLSESFKPSDGTEVPGLVAAQTALDKLKSLRPFGIQDNELVPVS